MILGTVTGQVVATIKHDAYANHRLLMVDPMNPGGKAPESYLVAVDSIGATTGQTVLIIDEGNSARQVLGDTTLPIRSVIIGIVDDVTHTTPNAMPGNPATRKKEA